MVAEELSKILGKFPENFGEYKVCPVSFAITLQKRWKKMQKI